MRKIISLLIATSTLISSFWAVNFQNKENVPAEDDKQIVLSEESTTESIHVFKPAGLESEKFTDGFSFDLHKKMIEIKSDLFFQNFKTELAAKEAQKIAEQQAKIAEEEKKAEAAVTQKSKPAASTVSNSTNTKPASGTPEKVSPKPAPAPTPTPTPTPPKKEEEKEEKPAPKPTPAPSGNVLSIAAQYTYVNTYTWGGTTAAGGFDCSGFTQFVFKEAGKSIPRDSRAQYSRSTKVSNPQPGDLVFFSGNRNGVITHVGIYTGGGQFIGSQSSTGVAYASAVTGYWGSRLVGYGRY